MQRVEQVITKASSGQLAPVRFVGFDALIWGVGTEEDRWSELVAQLPARTDARVFLLADHFEAAQAAYEAGADQVCRLDSQHNRGYCLIVD